MSGQPVIVVGGGLGGLTAALYLARSAVRVTLYEKEPRLGGQLIPAIVPPGKDKIEPLYSYLTTQVRMLGVKVKLGKEVTRAVVKAAKPDAVILATGMNSVIPDIPGIDKGNVATAVDVLTDRVEAGMEVAIKPH